MYGSQDRGVHGENRVNLRYELRHATFTYFQKSLKCFIQRNGEMAERLNALVLKTSKPSRVSRVRIPVSPPVLVTQTGI